MHAETYAVELFCFKKTVNKREMATYRAISPFIIMFLKVDCYKIFRWHGYEVMV